ncbi:MAG: VOC family protein [Salibacteraceae bacterium]
MRFLEVTFQTMALIPMKEFYVDVLGLTEIEADENSFAVKIGTEILRFTTATTDGTPRYHFAINIPENQVTEAEAWLEQWVELLPFKDRNCIDFPDWNAKALYFHDPAGNIVEFIARHDLPNAHHGPFGAHCLLNLSEVGLTVPSTLQFATQIRAAFGVKVWERSTVASTFAALGTGDRLLIVSRINRNWFPTGVPGLPWPMELVMEGDENKVWEHPELPYRFETRPAS